MLETKIIYAIIVVTIFSFGYVILLNLESIKMKSKKDYFRGVMMQLLAITIWISILTNIFWPSSQNESNITFEIALFIISIISGVFLIKSIYREIETDSSVEKLINKINENNKSLRNMEIQKSEFISLASHQLRGPLVNIRGYASVILEGDYGKIPEELKSPLEKIYQSSNFMSLLINDLLNVSRIEKGQIEYLLEEFDLTKVLNEIIQEFSKTIKDKGLKLRIKFDEKREIKVNADISKTKQIIYNLIDNSIKYTPKGTIEIRLERGREFAKISIEDTGIGVSEEMKSRIFKKFSRDKDALEIDVSGTGLGLYVAHNMIGSMGGKLSVESEGRGKGSTFYMELPLV